MSEFARIRVPSIGVAERLYRFGKERPSRDVFESFTGGPIDPAELRRMMTAPPAAN